MAVLPDTFTPIHAQRHKQQLLMQTSAPAPDSLIVVAVARALFWAGLLESGAFARVSDPGAGRGAQADHGGADAAPGAAGTGHRGRPGARPAAGPAHAVLADAA